MQKLTEKFPIWKKELNTIYSKRVAWRLMMNNNGEIKFWHVTVEEDGDIQIDE